MQPVQKYFWSGIFEIMPHALGLLLLCATYVYYMHWHLFRQPTNPTSQSTNQPFPRPSVHPAVWLSIQTVSRCSCQRSILQFIIIVIDSFEWLQWQTGLPSADRGRDRDRERESTCPGCDCIAFDLFGPARFMRIRHGKLPATAKLVTDFNV